MSKTRYFSSTFKGRLDELQGSKKMKTQLEEEQDRSISEKIILAEI